MSKGFLLKLFVFLVLCGTSLTAFGQGSLRITAPASLEGEEFLYLEAAFGPTDITGISGEIVQVQDTSANPAQGCFAATNDLTGKIALIDRGSCAFVQKATNAQAAGAIAAVICNQDNAFFVAGGDDGGTLSIPTVTFPSSFCDAIKTELGNGLMGEFIAGPNTLCTEATEVEPGTITVDSIFAADVVGSDPTNDDATAAAWYSFTPEEDGLMTISSCLGGADTRAWVWTGDCRFSGQNLSFVAGNDDACLLAEGGDPYASFIEVPVQGGVTYFIEWDDRWDASGFDWTLDFTAGAIELAPGQVCDSAIAVTPGTITIDSISQYGQTGEYNLNGSEWYSFTPDMDGVMSITSCGAGVDSRLLVWTGSCGNPNLVALSDDECPAFEGDTDNLAASVEGLVVQAGTTYLIEWSGIYETTGFDFEVVLDTLPEVNVTFSVDMAATDMVADTIQMVYAGPSATTIDDVSVVMMSDEDGDNKWEVTLPFTTLDTIGYAFVNGALDVANVETVPEDCGLPSGFGFNIRPLIVTGTEDFATDLVCFGSCQSCGPESCAEPFVLIEDDYESYTAGEEPVADYIQPWAGGNFDLGTISTDQALSGEQSYRITGDGSDVDPILLLGDQTEGHYIVRWEMYIPEGNGAYYNFQHFEESGIEWAFQITIEDDGIATLDAGEAARVTFEIRNDAWMTMAHYVDLDNDVIRLYVDGSFISSWPFNWQTFETSGTKQLGAVNFYPRSTNDILYIDDFYYAEIPAAGEGQYCYTATEIGTGVHTVADLECFGAGFSVRAEGQGQAGAWYSYTAEADGYISVSSCGGAADSRVWIFEDGCETLNVVGVNDDQCLQASGDPFASYREASVTAGETYLIMWDNVWDNSTFDFELTFTEGALPEGNFCESALAIEPGTITVDTMDGNAAVAGPNIGFFVASTTPYTTSEWFSFTPTEDGTMSVYSCLTLPDAAGVYVYSGECGIESLELIASDPSGCDPDAATRGVSVTAGTTYYIEWAAEADETPGFDFTLEFGPPTVEVTFQVDAAVLEANGELAEDGMFIAGEFNTWTGEPMADDDEDGIWTLTVPVAVGDTVEYKFQNGEGEFEDVDTSIGDDCTLGGFGNRFVIVGETAETLDPVCYGFCVSCEAVDVNDPVFNGALTIAPNPAREVANVQYHFDQATDISIRMTNSLGQLILERQIDGALSGNEELNVAGMASGMYFLHITDGVRSKTETLVIQQ